jgi:glycosyltransferase involved in cell wall biosynthesis
MAAIKLGVVCDLREEGWHSMDLLADMLMETLPETRGAQVDPTRLCPTLSRRWTRLPLVGGTARARLGDRLTARLWDYPRWLAPRAEAFDLFHIVDHSYAHLVRALPADRVVITCNDVDAIVAALPGHDYRFSPARRLAAGILEGLGRAAYVACISEATRAQLVATGRVDPERVGVVYLGVHPSCSAAPAPRWDHDVALRLGPPSVDLLHVGSTIPRKRLDTLLEVFCGVRETLGNVRLLRVGGLLTAQQRALARTLGVDDAIVEFPFLERPLLAALYRRASLVLLPSDREGFGLPLVEAMACGTPVVASAISALLEVGGDATTYCAPGDVPAWVNAVVGLLRQKQSDAAAWHARRQECISTASRFDWKLYAEQMTDLYCSVTSAAATGV